MKKRFLSVLLALALCAGLAVPAAASAPDRFDGSWRAQVSDNSWEAIRCTNVERAKEGLRPLSTFEALHAAGQLRAVELKDKFDHTRPNGQGCMTALYDVGLDPYAFTRSGENIASGYGTPASVVTGWMNSPGHRMNILTGPFCHIGMGCDGRRWVQMFLGICAPQLTSVTVGKSSYPVGTALEDMEGVVTLHCEHGDSYLPLSPEMCTGYDSTRTGSQSVTVHYVDQTISFTVTLKGSPRFADVPSDAFYADAVDWAVEKKITTGTTAAKFSPDEKCTHIQILTFLYRAVEQIGNPSGADMNLAVQWAMEEGMIGANFNGGAFCTRADAVNYIWQALGRQDAPASSFTDVPAGAAYARAVDWAVANGVTNGTNTAQTRFSPNDICTRGHIVTFLHRAYVPEARQK